LLLVVAVWIVSKLVSTDGYAGLQTVASVNGWSGPVGVVCAAWFEHAVGVVSITYAPVIIP